MRAILGLVAALMTITVASPVAMAKEKKTAAAKATSKAKAKSRVAKKPQFSGRLLTFRQLKTLSREKRMQYIRGVAELLVLMEASNARYVTADNSRASELKEYVALLRNELQVLPEAAADKTSPNANFQKVDYVVNIVPDYDAKNNRFTCAAGARFDYLVGACLQVNEFGEYIFTDDKCPTPNATEKIPYLIANTVVCVPKKNWELIERQEPRRASMRKGEFNLGSSLHAMPPEKQIGIVLPAAESGGSSVASNQDPKSKNAQAAADRKVMEAASKDAPPSAADAGNADAKAEEAGADAKACVPQANACKELSDADRATAITRFRSTAKYGDVDANVCISGGFLSSYKTSRKAEGKCITPQALSFKEFPQPLKCPDDQFMCNPVLFCLTTKQNGKSSPAIRCVEKDTVNKRNMQITRACARDYQSVLAGTALAETGKPEKLVAEACDPKNMPDELAVVGADGVKKSFKAEWDEMVRNTEKMRDVWCGTSDFAALFCDECSVISEKIYQINKGVTGSGCPEQTVAAVKAEVPKEESPAAAPSEDSDDVESMKDDATTVD